uniref:Uncharacterized protein n=1 Tax=Parascaris univalens TaxID=6257 RepID=A0A915A5K8_PARUN
VVVMSLFWLTTTILLVILILLILGFWHEYFNELKVEEERRISSSRRSEMRIESENKNERNLEKCEDEMIAAIAPSV